MSTIKISELNQETLYEVYGNHILGGFGYTAGAVANQYGVAVSAGSGSIASFTYTGFNAAGRAFSLSFAF